MEYYNPVHIVAGERAVAQLPELLSTIAVPQSPVLLISRGSDFLTSPVYRKLLASLENWQVHSLAFTVSNPDVRDIAALLPTFKDRLFSCIIAIGGGSVMDTAKTLALALPARISDAAELRSFISAGQYDKLMPIPWIGIPTTAGTGSEVTPWATVWDRECECKMSCSYTGNFAKIALLDPDFTKSCPLSLTVSSALDAVCHAAESYWSRHTNEISRLYALKAIGLIRDNLEALVGQPDDEQLRLTVAKASLYAGLAFSNTRTTVCHSVSYPLTEKFGVPHGIAAALTLAEFMSFNQDAIVDFDSLLQAFGAFSVQNVSQWLQAMMRLGGFGPTLRSYGLVKSDLDYIVAHAFTKGRADNNPVPVSKGAVQAVLQRIYE